MSAEESAAVVDEEMVKALEEELHQTRNEMSLILLDIRAFIMEVKNPLRPYEPRKTPVQANSGKGVEQNDSRKENRDYGGGVEANEGGAQGDANRRP
jgi:hypothetical protein